MYTCIQVWHIRSQDRETKRFFAASRPSLIKKRSVCQCWLYLRTVTFWSRIRTAIPSRTYRNLICTGNFSHTTRCRRFPSTSVRTRSACRSTYGSQIRPSATASSPGCPIRKSRWWIFLKCFLSFPGQTALSARQNFSCMTKKTRKLCWNAWT